MLLIYTPQFLFLPRPIVSQDDDEVTNQRGGSIRRREQAERQEGGGGGGGGEGGRQGGDFVAPSSRWNIDGSEIANSDIEVRYAWSITLRSSTRMPRLPDSVEHTLINLSSSFTEVKA